MSNRVVIGKKTSGAFGLSVSLPSVDALTADVNGGGFSFDDSWTDVAQVAVVGTGAAPSGNLSSATIPSTDITHGLGYVPFCEFRQLIGSNEIYDDYMSVSNGLASNRLAGLPVQVDASAAHVLGQQSGNSSGGLTPYQGYSFIFIIYKISVPNPS